MSLSPLQLKWALGREAPGFVVLLYAENGHLSIGDAHFPEGGPQFFDGFFLDAGDIAAGNAQPGGGFPLGVGQPPAKAGKDEEEFIVCADDTLDLAPLVTEDILLELPTRILCREDCKGLCPKCGTNLNESTCDCNQDAEVDSRLSVLLTLLDQDDEN